MLTLLITAILGFFGIFLVEVDTKKKARARGQGIPESSTGSSSTMENGHVDMEEDTKNDKNGNNTSISAPVANSEKPTIDADKTLVDGTGT